MEKENKKATASEKLTKVVAIRISQTDYDIFLEKAKMENFADRKKFGRIFLSGRNVGKNL